MKSSGSSTPSDAAFDAELAELRAAYAARLPGYADEITAAVAERAEPPRRAVALRLSHRMRGTAGSYGFVDVAEAAGALEDALLADAPNVEDAARSLYEAIASLER